jgi:hypothetical protein
LGEVFRIVDTANRKEISVPTTRAAFNDGRQKPSTNCLLIHRDGHEYFIEQSVSLVHDCEGKAAGSVIIFRGVDPGYLSGFQQAFSD